MTQGAICSGPGAHQYRHQGINGVFEVEEPLCSDCHNVPDGVGTIINLERIEDS